MSIPEERIPDSAKSNVLPFPNQEPAIEKVVVANRFVLTDTNGKERALLFMQDDMAMFVLCDNHEEARLLLAVTSEGFAIISAPHRNDDGTMDDSFRLVVSNGEPEMIMRDAIFKNCTVISANGLISA